jgi:hypothetical protein
MSNNLGGLDKYSLDRQLNQAELMRGKMYDEKFNKLGCKYNEIAKILREANNNQQEDDFKRPNMERNELRRPTPSFGAKERKEISGLFARDLVKSIAEEDKKSKSSEEG